MRQRTITAVFFAAAMIGGIFGGIYTFLLLFGLIAAGAIWELNGLLDSEKNGFARKILGVAIGVLPYAALACDKALLGSHSGWCGTGRPAFNALDVIFCGEILLVTAAFLLELFGKRERPFSNIGHDLVGLFYVGIPCCLLVAIAVENQIYAPYRVFGLLWLVWTNDTLAYLIGSRIGRRKLFPRISPNKTWEGTVGGALCTVGMAGLLSVFFKDFTMAQWLALGAVVGLFGTPGDLVESLLKRSVGVKDSGNLLPGHGGLLDRFDAFLFVLPVAWLVLRLLGG